MDYGINYWIKKIRTMKHHVPPCLHMQLQKASTIEILDDEYREMAFSGWEGLKTRITDSGIIEGVCTGTIVYDDLQPYYDRPTPLNDIHGIGAVLLAGIEIARLQEMSS